jgi:segregation and condensation protein B
MDISLKNIVEGIIFVFGEEGVSLLDLSNALVYPQEQTRILCDELINEYKQELRGFELVVSNDKYKFISQPEIKSYVERLVNVAQTKQLSQSALETLAIIAYKQPITRVEIEELRGVGCELMLKKLQSLDLVRENGRSNAVGKPILYEITETFLDLFKLISLAELPNLPNYQEETEGSQYFE